MCLSHEFPRQQLGDVGYLTFGGHFVKLFNAIEPLRSSGGRIKTPGIGKVSCVDRQQKENIVLKGFKAISKLVSPGESSLSEGFKRRHTFSLAGERTAFLCAEKTRHRYIEDSRPCKKWFRAYWQDILHEYGEEHVLQKDDLVLKTLSAQNYALFANHGHASSDAHFDVLASPGVNEPWGSFILPPDQPNAPPRLLHSKVSIIGSPSKTILITRLRFRPDVEEPTIRD
ncbi:hypothetical protein H0H93_008526 [Arthromyces matolae]|nr:hypothetical protein H0H93_008526 [Arthromyces matolae]